MNAFTRRPFLGILASLAVAACAPPRNAAEESGSPASSAAPASGDVEKFMALSAFLTGYNDLDETTGATYLNDLRENAARGAILDDVFKRETFDATIFNDREQLSLASQILQTWYSGISTGANGPATVTWTQALAWRACRFTKPPSICAIPGSWTKAPT